MKKARVVKMMITTHRSVRDVLKINSTRPGVAALSARVSLGDMGRGRGSCQAVTETQTKAVVPSVAATASRVLASARAIRPGGLTPAVRKAPGAIAANIEKMLHARPAARPRPCTAGKTDREVPAERATTTRGARALPPSVSTRGAWAQPPPLCARGLQVRAPKTAVAQSVASLMHKFARLSTARRPGAATSGPGPAIVKHEGAVALAKKAKAPARQFGTHQERRFAQAERHADELIDELPACAIRRALGDASACQLSGSDQRRLFRVAVLAKGGPDGSNTHKAVRFWRLLQKHCNEHGLAAFGLPASAGLVALIVAQEADRARRAAKGSQGGATVGETIREGAMLLATLGLPITAEGAVIEANARTVGPRVAVVKRVAGSLPIGVQCQVEHLAACAEPSALRLLARCFLLAAFTHNVRLNDALNAKIWPDEREPSSVVRGSTQVASKDAMVLDLFAPARGWLGPFEWLGEHLREMHGRGHAVPDYKSRPAGKPSAPGTAILEGVCSPDHARKALKDMCAQPPLNMSVTEFEALHLTTHSIHGTGPDMARTLNAFGLDFAEHDARALGHWLRDKNAPQPDPRRVPGAPTRNQADGQPIARGAMNFRYTQGQGRRGEREEQLDVRARLVEAVERALGRSPQAWWELPKTLDSWDVLKLAADGTD